jgi:hypothetical protein
MTDVIPYGSVRSVAAGRARAPVTAFWYAFRLSGRLLAGIGTSRNVEVPPAIGRVSA